MEMGGSSDVALEGGYWVDEVLEMSGALILRLIEELELLHD
jgi:hypothetical protein